MLARHSGFVTRSRSSFCREAAAPAQTRRENARPKGTMHQPSGQVGPGPTSHPRPHRCAVGLQGAGITAAGSHPTSPTCFFGPAEGIEHCKPCRAPGSSHGVPSCEASTRPSPGERHELPLCFGGGRCHGWDRASSEGLGRWLEAVLPTGSLGSVVGSPRGTDTSTQMCHRISSVSHPPLSVALGPGQGKSLVKTLLLMFSEYNTERYPTVTSQPPSREHLLQRRGPRQHPRVAVPVAVPAWEGGSSQHCFLLHQPLLRSLMDLGIQLPCKERGGGEREKKKTTQPSSVFIFKCYLHCKSAGGSEVS